MYCVSLFLPPKKSYFQIQFQSSKHHHQYHEGLARREFNCPHCRYVTSEMKLLSEHCLKNHAESMQKPFKCEICDSWYLFEESLIHHQVTCHGHQIDKLLCDFACPREFYSKASQTVHHLMHNQNQNLEDISEVYLCKHCTSISSNIQENIQHYREFHEMNNLPYFPCEDCEFVSPKQSETAEHMKDEHENEAYNPYKCKHCNYSATKSVLFYR